MRHLIARALATLALLLCVRQAQAHPPTTSSTVVTISNDGGLAASITFDPVALLSGKSSRDVTDAEIETLLAQPATRLESALRALQIALLADTALWADEQRLIPTCTAFPCAADLQAWLARHRQQPTAAAMRMSLRAQLPTACRAWSVSLPASLGPSMLTIERPGLPRLALPLEAGAQSPSFDVSVAAMPGSAAAASATQSGPSAPPTAKAENETNDPTPASVLWRYMRLGFHHIVPEGADHALFVLGLFLLSPRLLPLAKQVTAFTLAHTVTLSLAVLGWVHVPASVVEPAIALSIGFIALENMFARSVSRWRLAVVFLFGLLHGLGFASGLAELGLPAGRLASGITGFALGVEAGHLAVIAAAFLLLGWTRDRPWYRVRVQLPGSAAIAAVACWWTVSRLLEG